MKNSESLGDRIYQRRQAMKISRKTLAARVGCSERLIQLLEGDRHKLSWIYKFHRLASQLNVTMDWLLVGKTGWFGKVNQDQPPSLQRKNPHHTANSIQEQ